jgi:hypothetical protein
LVTESGTATPAAAAEARSESTPFPSK